MFFIFFFSSRRRHTRSKRDWSSDVCSSDLVMAFATLRDAVHYKDFWLLAGTYFVCGASTNGLIGTHLIPACMDHGFTAVTRSEERRVGKERRSWLTAQHLTEKLLI